MHLVSVWSLDPSQSLPWALSPFLWLSRQSAPNLDLVLRGFWSVEFPASKCLRPSLVARVGQGQLCHLGGEPGAWTDQQGTWSWFLPFWVLSDPVHPIHKSPTSTSLLDLTKCHKKPWDSCWPQFQEVLLVTGSPPPSPPPRQVQWFCPRIRWDWAARYSADTLILNESCQTQNTCRALGHWRSTAGSSLEQPKGALHWISPGGAPTSVLPMDHRIKDSRGGNRCSLPCVPLSRHCHSLPPHHHHHHVVVTHPCRLCHTSASSRGGCAWSSEGFPDIAPQYQHAIPINVCWPLMNMVLSWAPRLVLSRARRGMGIPWVNGTSLFYCCLLVEICGRQKHNQHKRDHTVGKRCLWPTNKVGRCTPLHFHYKTPKSKFIRNLPQQIISRMFPHILGKMCTAVITHKAQKSPLRAVGTNIHRPHHQRCSVGGTDVASIKWLLSGSSRNKIYIVSIASRKHWHWEQ